MKNVRIWTLWGIVVVVVLDGCCDCGCCYYCWSNDNVWHMCLDILCIKTCTIPWYFWDKEGQYWENLTKNLQKEQQSPVVWVLAILRLWTVKPIVIQCDLAFVPKWICLFFLDLRFLELIIYLPLGIQSRCQMMIGVYNHLRNASYLGSITILRRWLDP